MKFVLLALFGLVLGATSYGSCNKISISREIERLQVPSSYQINSLLGLSSLSGIGTAMEKYGKLLLLSQREIEVSNYLYSFERTHPVLGCFCHTIPILATWVYVSEDNWHSFLSVSAFYIPFAISWFISMRYIFCGYNEEDCRLSKRTVFPSEGGYEALEGYFDKEARRVSYIISLRMDAMNHQKKEIVWCNGVRIAISVLAFILGIVL